MSCPGRRTKTEKKNPNSRKLICHFGVDYLVSNGMGEGNTCLHEGEFIAI